LTEGSFYTTASRVVLCAEQKYFCRAATVTTGLTSRPLQVSTKRSKNTVSAIMKPERSISRRSSSLSSYSKASSDGSVYAACSYFSLANKVPALNGYSFPTVIPRLRRMRSLRIIPSTSFSTAK
jgi:hypothetical protein